MPKCTVCGKLLRSDREVCPFCKSNVSQYDGGAGEKKGFVNWRKVGLIIVILIGGYLLLSAVKMLHMKSSDVSGNSGDVKALLAILKDTEKNIEVRMEAAGKLKGLDLSQAKQALAEIKSDPSLDHRIRHAASTYQELTPIPNGETFRSQKEALETNLKRLATSKNYNERSQAAVKLGNQIEYQKSKAYDREVSGNIAPDPDLIDLSYFVGPLIEATRDPFPEVRASALGALSKVNQEMTTEIQEAFYKLLYDPSYLVKCTVIRELAQRKTPVIIDPMIKFLDSPDKWVQLEAINGIGYMGVKDAVPKLTGLLKDKDKEVADRAGAALKNISGEIPRKSYW